MGNRKLIMRQENNKVLMRSWVVGQQGKVKVINQMKTFGQYDAIGHASDMSLMFIHTKLAARMTYFLKLPACLN